MTATPMTRIAAMTIALIQMGESTHHHDQAITSHNLSTTNAIVRSPTTPTPLLDELESAISISPHLRVLPRGNPPRCGVSRYRLASLLVTT